MRIPAAAAALAALTGLTPPPASPVQAEAAPKVDPCSLVTRAEVEQTVGALKSPPTSRTRGRMRTCAFEFADAANELELMVFPASGLERARALHKDLAPVIGFALEAYSRIDRSIDWLELYARKGDVTLQVTMKNGPGVEGKVKALAKMALSRL